MAIEQDRCEGINRNDKSIERLHSCAERLRVVLRGEKVLLFKLVPKELVAELCLSHVGANVGFGDEVEERGVRAT